MQGVNTVHNTLFMALIFTLPLSGNGQTKMKISVVSANVLYAFIHTDGDLRCMADQEICCIGLMPGPLRLAFHCLHRRVMTWVTAAPQGEINMYVCSVIRLNTFVSV